jgi:opacity protein-like surface antigen
MRLTMVIPGALLAIGAAATPSVAHAQVGLGVGGGVTIPVSALSDVNKTGYNILADLSFRAPTSPLGFRVDGMFNSLPTKVTDARTLQVWTLNANLVANLTSVPHAPIAPYLIAGIGWYNDRYRVRTSGTTVVASGSTSDNNFGINGGLGLRIALGKSSLFGEARYHYVFTPGQRMEMIPITIGINFGN